MRNAPFSVFTATTAATAEYNGLGTTVREAGPGGWALAVVVVLLSAEWATAWQWGQQALLLRRLATD